MKTNTNTGLSAHKRKTGWFWCEVYGRARMNIWKKLNGGNARAKLAVDDPRHVIFEQRRQKLFDGVMKRVKIDNGVAQ
jgi:hypothetical protein